VTAAFQSRIAVFEKLTQAILRGFELKPQPKAQVEAEATAKS